MTASGGESVHAALVLNPVKVDAERLRSALISLSRRHGWAAPRFYETSIDDPGQRITPRAIADGAAAALARAPVKAAAGRLRSALISLSRRHGWAAPRFYETSIDDPGQRITRQAIDDGAAAVLAAGGDGTVRAVSEAMAYTGIPFAVVP